MGVVVNELIDDSKCTCANKPASAYQCVVGSRVCLHHFPCTIKKIHRHWPLSVGSCAVVVVVVAGSGNRS